MYLIGDLIYNLCEILVYRGADKSLARPGRKQTAPVKSMMGRAMD